MVVKDVGGISKPGNTELFAARQKQPACMIKKLSQKERPELIFFAVGLTLTLWYTLK